MSLKFEADTKAIESVILRAVTRNTTQAAIASEVGISDATVSRLLSEHLEKFAAVLAAAGLKVVPEDSMLVPHDMVSALLVLAKAHLEGVNSAFDLVRKT